MGRVGPDEKLEPFGHRGVFADAVCDAEDGRKMNFNFDESARARVGDQPAIKRSLKRWLNA